MAEQLKNMFFQAEFIEDLGSAIEEVYPGFDRDAFRGAVFDDGWPSLELKQRMRQVSKALQRTLPDAYLDALSILKAVGPRFKGFDAMVFPDFVECFGLGHFDESMEALELFTLQCSSEFAVRPFLDIDPDRALMFHHKWAESGDERVRRLASEGCRPRLPWAMALPGFKEDPSPVLAILERLKDDESETVRRSVANNLNDISKDNPDVALEIISAWLGNSEQRDRLAKHAARTLLKAGHTGALILFGFGDPSHVDVDRIEIDNSEPAIGDQIRFTFRMDIREEEPALVRLEYAVWYVKARGSRSRKIFQIREATYKPGTHIISRRIALQDLSTRKHYPGEHKIEIIVNGVVKATTTFELKDSGSRVVA